ncbi:MAG: SDR family oxidoreductase [Elusimicrobiota bacterium]|nr:SDR family oxidoreductase [Endomicrobiia bacterium]MDW8165186.1 SDR family oxidoreductase [Elusimicrobiota bacterium]
MKILITGGAGFIGSNIVDECIKKGWNVIVVDNLSTGKKENINYKAKFYNVDITDFETLKKVFEKENPDIINHHAAQIDVRKSVANPQYDASINIIGSLNLLELSVKCKVKKFIFASSGGTIYGECKGKRLPKESNKPLPESPYGCAKASVEFYMWYYHKVYGLNVISLRYANVYGPRQDPFGEAGVISIFINRMLNNEDVYIFGDGKQMRDFVFVKDVVDANIKSMLSNKNFGIYNVGSGKTISIISLFKKLKNLLNYNKSPIYQPPRKGEILKSCLSIDLIKKELNWSPKVSLDEGLKKTIEYFKNKMR